MSDTDRFDFSATIAPHVDRAWATDFVWELRLGTVSGEDIGAALAEVESHVTDSGMAAAEAFGDPAAYARSLGLPPDPGQSTRALWRDMAPMLVQLAGLWVATTGLGSLVRGDAAYLGLSPLLMIAAVVAVVAANHWVLRLIQRHPIVSVALFVVTLTIVVAPDQLFPSLRWHVDATAATVVGLVLVTVGSVIILATGPRLKFAGLITPPLPSPASPRPKLWAITIVRALAVPLAAGLITGLTYLVFHLRV
ncbi:MAG: hypothetical protein LBK42_02650 [Propionibacteriaceae bacterium]|jgi:hypothetical protein|nr:hypothetical protein [Propionibacteriaceae bacterium]